jgi:hypothetical protein
MSTRRSLVIALVGAYSLLLSCSGAWAWQANINSGWVSSVAVDAAGNVIAAGSTNKEIGSAFTVIKYNGVSGGEIWRRVISATFPDGFDVAYAVTLDGAGNVVAAGVTNSGCVAGWDCELVFGDFIVIKFSGADGTELWRQVIGSASNSYGSATYNSANAVAVDRAGNVVAAGSIPDRATFTSAFSTIKFNGATGQELWRQVINGSASGSANSVAADPRGNVVAAGSTGNDFTVVKFNSSSIFTADFDGNDISDIGVYRDGIWFIRRSSDGGMTA